VLATVDADEHQPLVEQMGVRSLPTVVLFKDGAVAEHFVGVIPEVQIRQLLERHVPAAKKSLLEQAREFKSAGEFAAAQLLLDQALTKEATSIELQCELAEVKALHGAYDEAKHLLVGVQAREPTAPPVKRLAALLEFINIQRLHPDAAAVRQRLSAEPNDLDARHTLAVHRFLAKDYDAALEDWLEMMRTHRKANDDLARKSLVMAFEIIGRTDPRVDQARRQMARMLF
jgi:putative thioredoxin